MKKAKREKLSALQKITAALPHVKARCKYFGECGGCLMQDVAYADQLTVKRELVNGACAAADIKFFDGTRAHVGVVAPSPEQWFYRNRMDYPVGENGEIGLKPFGKWRDVINLTECFLLSRETPEILQLVRDWMARWHLPGWNNKQYTGYVRYVVIREGKHTGERMVMVVTAADDAPAASECDVSAPELWNDLVERMRPFATTVIHAVNATITDISIPSELRVLHGAPFFFERVGDVTYKIAPTSFFQTNSAGAELLQRTVRRAVRGTRVLDLYCGLGFFSIDLARHGKKVLGVELDAGAIDLARENAAAHGAQHDAEFFASSIEEWIKTGGSARVSEYAPDTIIVDPPRAGLHPRVVEWLALYARRYAPFTLVYVSCNYEQFVREWNVLKNAYTLMAMHAVDMFPHTPHVELVVVLTPIKKQNDVTSA